MGAFGAKQRSNAWRFTDVNADYEFCSTYPAKLVVPSKVSDVTLKYGKGYRSKQRVPALVYLHWANLVGILLKFPKNSKSRDALNGTKFSAGLDHSRLPADGRLEECTLNTRRKID